MSVLTINSRKFFNSRLKLSSGRLVPYLYIFLGYNTNTMDCPIIAIVNPKSSNAARVSTKLKRLEKKQNTPITVIQSDRNPAVFEKKFIAYIAKNVKEPTVVLVGGGDGTVHHVVAATAALPASLREHIILFPIWGGNANDFAFMLNGLPVRKDLAQLIERGQTVKIHPLEISLKNKSAKTIGYAICYASFGASAAAADELNKTGAAARAGLLSNVPIIVVSRELMRVVTAFVHTSAFRATVNGKRVKIFEQVFANGSRIAKVDRLPVTLTDKAFYTVLHTGKHSNIVIRVIKLLSGKGKKVGHVTSQPVSFKVKEPVLGQYDGEVFKIPRDTRVEIRISKKYIYALSTRLTN